MTEDSRDGNICIDFATARLNRTKDMLHSETRALFDYWDRLRNGRKLPYRAEIDPRDMGCDARHLFILEHLGEANIRFRLAGTALVDAFAMELRGMSVRAIMRGKARESMTALVEETLAEPGIGYARLSEAANPDAVWEILLLPLKSDFGKTDRIIGALHRVEPSAKNDLSSLESLHFDIKEMTIRPVTGTSGDERVPQPARTPRSAALQPAGFAEKPTPFRGPAKLTAIEGGKQDGSEGNGEEPPTPQRRPNLRIVSDD
ncbi:MAG: PAS domain-containing protein [Pseudomonadota bacterium]